VRHDRTIIAVAHPEFKRFGLKAHEWLDCSTCACNRYVEEKRCQSRRGSTCGEIHCAQIKKREDKQKLTVCYWKPSVLLLDFKFVGQTRGVWVLRVVHLFRIVRRLYTLYFVRIFWRGCRHIVFGCLQASDSRFFEIPWMLCWPTRCCLHVACKACGFARYADFARLASILWESKHQFFLQPALCPAA
jgi:hypothetical protein